jgi:hypothetical protein
MFGHWNKNPIIIFVPLELFTAGNGWIRTPRRIRKLPQKLRNPKRPTQPIPSFDRRALRERVERFLRETQQQREGLRAAACG